MSKTISKRKSFTWGLVSLATIVMTWGFVTPALEFPDEQAHLGTVSYLAREGHLPGYHVPDMTIEMTEVETLLGTLRDGHGNNKYTYHPDYHVEYTDSTVGKYEKEISDLSDLNNTHDRSTYTSVEEAARYPVLYYAYGSIFWQLWQKADLLGRIFAVRLGSVIIAWFMALVSYRLGLLVFKKKLYAITLASATLLQPMMSFVTAGTNSDNLHNLLFIYATYLGILVIDKGIKPRTILLMLFTLLADIYTKPQGFIMIPVLVLAIFLRVLKERKYKLLLWVFALTLATIFLGWGQLDKYKGFLNIANTHGASFVDYLHFSANKLVAQNIVWYWGVFKWLGVVLPPIYWRVANRVVLLSAIGLVVYLYKVIKHKKVVADLLFTLYLLLVASIYAAVIFWFDWQYMKGWGFSLGIQARYFFPTIISHLSLMLIGVTSLGWNKRTRIILRKAFFILFLWLQIGGIWRLLTIYYDTSSVSVFINQLSQYKPPYLKGGIWYLWTTLYISSLLYLSVLNLFKKKAIKT